MSMARTVRNPDCVSEGPDRVDQAQVLANLVARRKRLHRHNRRVLPAASGGYFALHERLSGHAPAYRCDQPRRKRTAQLAGERGVAVEDLYALMFEGQLGADAVSDLCSDLLGHINKTVACSDPVVAPAAEAAADVIDTVGDLTSGLVRDLADGRMTPAEAVNRLPGVRKLKELVGVLEAAMVDAAAGVVNELAAAESGR